MQFLPTLRLFFRDGLFNDYRLRDRCVEFRTSEGQGAWRVLDDSDLQLHYRFNTEVARWLRKFELGSNIYARLA